MKAVNRIARDWRSEEINSHSVGELFQYEDDVESVITLIRAGDLIGKNESLVAIPIELAQQIWSEE